MAMLCICGVCIPYSVLWPFVLLILKQMWSFLYPAAKNTEKPGNKCTKLDTHNDPSTTSTEATAESEPVLEFPRKYTSDMDWESIISRDTPTIFRFTAKWCKPCKALDPLVEEISKDHIGQAEFYDVDVDECDEIAALNGAVAIPLFVSYRSGKKLESLRSHDLEQIEAFVHHAISASS